MGSLTSSATHLGKPEDDDVYRICKSKSSGQCHSKSDGARRSTCHERVCSGKEELIENLTKKHAKQVEALINSNTEAMTKLVELLLKGPTLATALDNVTLTSLFTAVQKK